MHAMLKAHYYRIKSKIAMTTMKSEDMESIAKLIPMNGMCEEKRDPYDILCIVIIIY